MGTASILGESGNIPKTIISKDDIHWIVPTYYCTKCTSLVYGSSFYQMLLRIKECVAIVVPAKHIVEIINNFLGHLLLTKMLPNKRLYSMYYIKLFNKQRVVSVKKLTSRSDMGCNTETKI